MNSVLKIFAAATSLALHAKYDFAQQSGEGSAIKEYKAYIQRVVLDVLV
jgi:hypothetical protein